ncbi:hypothetical protein ACHAWF_000619 [Thalassiosira exigua]
MGDDVIGRTMKKWSDEGSLLSSYLLVASSQIFYKRDHVTKKGFAIDHIVDSAWWEPAYMWTALEAAKLGVPVPTTNAALETRFLSAMKDERVEAQSVLKVPELPDTPSVLRSDQGGLAVLRLFVPLGRVLLGFPCGGGVGRKLEGMREALELAEVHNARRCRRTSAR